MVNGLITLLAAMILLAVLLYWNTQNQPEEAAPHQAPDRAPHGETSVATAAAATPEAASAPSFTVEAPPAEPAPEAPDQPADDLTKIEGVGPKIASLLAEAGLPSYAALAAAEVSRLQAILEAAGSRYRLADPTTWPEQAQLAARGDWDQLAALQEELSGGRDRSG